MATAFSEHAHLFESYVWRYFDGLTDEELHWEPVPAMWGLRPKADLRTPLPADSADGDWWLDGIRPPPDPEPLTTIGWRIAHLVLGTWNWLGPLTESARPPEPGLSGDVGTLLPLWRSVLDEFITAVDGFEESDFDVEVMAGTHRLRRSWIVSHMTLEISLHGAEVGTMRHLFRATPKAAE